MRNSDYNERITDFITENITELAQKKYSSNVIDRVNLKLFLIIFSQCILSSEIENESKMRSKIINAIIKEKIVVKLLLDKFGNYGNLKI